MHGLPFIQLNRRKLKRAAIVAAGLLTIFTLAVVFLCARLGIHSRMDIVAYYAMVHEHYDPIWKDLDWRPLGRAGACVSAS